MELEAGPSQQAPQQLGTPNSSWFWLEPPQLPSTNGPQMALVLASKTNSGPDRSSRKLNCWTVSYAVPEMKIKIPLKSVSTETAPVLAKRSS